MSENPDFHESIVRHELPVDPSLTNPLADYARTLWDWNSRLNLTRHTDIESFVTRDLADTLQLLPFIRNGASLVDVGTGGGVPGMLLAILRPDLHVTLVESVARKCEALGAMTESLKLDVEVENARAEAHLQENSYSVLTARAVAGLPKLLTWFRPAIQNGNLERALFIKGPNWVSEKNDASKRRLLSNLKLEPVASWRNVGRDGESVLLELRRER